MASVEMSARRRTSNESASLLAGGLGAGGKRDGPGGGVAAGGGGAVDPGGGSGGSWSKVRHQQVVGFLKSVWRDEDVAMSEQAPPAPSRRAKEQTLGEAMAWQSGLSGAPRVHSRRFFLVD